MVAAEASSPVRHSFALPPLEAAESLKEFARQSMADIVFDSEDVEGVVTNGVDGVMSPAEALQKMLAGTGLSLKEDMNSGAFAVVKMQPAPGVNYNNNSKPSKITMTDEKESVATNAPDTKRRLFPLIRGIITAVAVTALPVNAQEDEGPQVFELSPFEVDASEDMGYVATSTLTGSRLNTRLEDVASSVSVFTEEFLDDTGLTDIQEITLYSVSMVNNLQEINNGPNINNFLGAANPIRRVRVRGVRATKGLNYFESFIPDDGYRVQRYDESRGPNGILFGISNAGGIVNTSTLRANTQKDSGRIRYSTGSYERNRLEARYNKVLIQDVLGVTLAGLNQDNEGWRNYEVDERERIYGAVAWKPIKRLTIQAMGESGNHFNTRIRPFNSTDQFLAWWLIRNKFGVDSVLRSPGIDDPNNAGSSEELFGVDRITSTNFAGDRRRNYIYNANNGTWINTAGLWESIGNDDQDVASPDNILAASSIDDLERRGGGNWDDPPKILPSLYREKYGFDYNQRLNAAGPGFFRDEDFEFWQVSADYRITENLYVNFAHGHQELEIDAQFDSGSKPEIQGDPNIYLRHPDIAEEFGYDPLEPNPYAGRLYFESQWRAQEHNIEYDETRAAISYDIDMRDHGLDWMGRHRLAAGLALRETSDYLIGKRYGFLGNPYDFRSDDDFDDPRNRISVRTYIDEGDFSTYVIDPPPLEITSFVADDGETRQVGYMHQDRGTANARSDIEVESHILAMQSFFWNDRIALTLGWREDEADNTAFGHVLDPLLGYTITTDPDANGFRNDAPISANTKTAGAVIDITENFSIVGNWATSIGLPEFRNIVFPNIGIPPPVEGEGYDVGIAFNFFEDRISGRLVYFDLEAKNRTSSGGGTRIISQPMRDSMRALNEVREFDPTIIKKADGSPYSDSEWEQEIADLNGGEGGGLNPRIVNAFLQDNFSEGVELSLTANITDNWRLTLNASKTDRLRQGYGREFIKAAGMQADEEGRLINPISVQGREAVGVDTSALSEGGIHRRILEIANNASGTITLEDGSTREITPGSGALLINTDSSFDTDLNEDESIAYRIYESIDDLDVRKFQRENRWGLAPYKFNMFTAYDFTEGMLDGFTLGGGYRYLDGAVISIVDGEEVTGPSESYFDLMMRYTYRLKNNWGRLVFQLNVQNLFDKTDPLPVRFVDNFDPSTPLSRFELIEPRQFRFTVTWSF